MVDPSTFQDSHQHVDMLQSVFSSLTISEGSDVAAIVAAPADPGAGPFGFLEKPIEIGLTTLHTGLAGLNVPGAWGLSIIGMTTLIKIVTYPLTAKQMQSTQKMQTLQPTIKEVQAKYASNPEVMNQKIAALYQENDVNPLAGCIPSLVQIPVFIGLYRAVLCLAKDGILDEPFLFLPSLEGPTYGADAAHGSDWILHNWVDGVPSLGWANTAAFLAVPLFLVVSQFFSMQLMAPKDQEQPAFLKFLPLLIGWFSLNVPSALGIYWVANNLFTTAISLQIKSSMPAAPAAAGGNTAALDVTPSSFSPSRIRDRAEGFGSSGVDEDGITPITSPIDAEVIEGIAQEQGEREYSSKKRNKKKKKKQRN